MEGGGMTDNQLKQLLAKMLPEHIKFAATEDRKAYLRWIGVYRIPVLDTELLHLCHLIEETLTGWDEHCESQQNNYYFGELWREANKSFAGIAHATWQQRTKALAKVKGIEIV